MMMTDALFSAPRLRVSQKQISAILDYAKQMAAKNVPSKDALKQFRKKCIEKLGDPTKKVRFASGNIAYVNDMHVAAARVSLAGGSILFQMLKCQSRPMGTPRYGQSCGVCRRTRRSKMWARMLST